MRVAGIFLSGLGHGLLIWLALLAPPWLRPHRSEPVATISVELVTGAELAALEAAALARGAAPSAPAPAAPQPSRETAAPQPPTQPQAAPEPEPQSEPSLAPAFDTEAPLGIDQTVRLAPVLPPPRRTPPAATEPPSAAPPSVAGNAGRARETRAGADGRAAVATGADYGMAVRAAIVKARVYPRVARDRGLVGEARLLVMVDRSGRLINARLLRSSGSRTLDDAALAAARNARLPAAPDDLAGPRFSFEVGLTFTFND